MAKEKLYRIKPDFRGYFLAMLRNDKRTRGGWNRMGVAESALEEVPASPEITHICLVSSYGSGDGGATMTFLVNFNGVLGERWNAKQRKAVEAKILGTISPLLVGKTWDELAGEGGKEYEHFF